MDQHFVYLYRDASGKPVYVGYGAASARASSHPAQTHNSEFETYLNGNDKYTVEISGPYDSEATALALETALISALSPQYNLFNKSHGSEKHRFRPLGVPEDFANRLALPPARVDDLMYPEPGQENIGPLLCVKLSNKNFLDGRQPYEPAAPPSDPGILERMEKWWYFGDRAESWKAAPESSPQFLLAIVGSPGSQIIVAAVTIDRTGWATAKRNGAAWQVPLLSTPGLNAHGLRGRRISRDAGLVFGRLFTEMFLRIECDGSILDGRIHK